MSKLQEYAYPFIAAVTFVICNQLLGIGGGAASLLAVLAMFIYMLLSMAFVYLSSKKDEVTHSEAELPNSKSPTTSHLKFCGQCGTKVIAGSNFCGQCGAKLSI